VSLGFAHELSLLAATLSALALVLVGGELPSFAWLTIIVPPLSFALKRRGLAAAASSGTALGFASIALGVLRLVVDGPAALVHGFGLMVAGLVAARALTRKTLAHDMQLLLLSLLLVLAGSVLNRGPSFFPLFLVFALTAVLALSTRQLLFGAVSLDGADASSSEQIDAVVRLRRDVVTPVYVLFLSSVAVVVLVSAALLFALFPRIGFFDLGLQAGATGQLPTSVSLGSGGFGRSDAGAIVARVRGVSAEAFERGLYLRGIVYDVVDENGFSRGQAPPAVSRRGHALGRAPEEVRYEVTLFPGMGDLLFSLGEVMHARSTAGGRQNPNVMMQIGAPDVRSEIHASRSVSATFRYEVRGGIASPGYISEIAGPSVDDDLAHFKELPANLDPRVTALAREFTGEATRVEERAFRIRDALYERFAYTLDRRDSDERAALHAFLFDTKEGHCEFFAAAYALLLRTQGIPARVVGGYQGGLVDPDDGTVVFYGANAHAWVEWYLPGKGWIVDDATPAVGAPRQRLSGLTALLEGFRRFWDDRVVDYSFEEQAALVRAASRSFSPEAIADAAPGPRGIAVGGALIAALGAVFVLVRRRRRGARDDALVLPRAIEGALTRVEGAPVDVARTLREAVAASRASAAARAVLDDSVAVYERARFGEIAVGHEEVRALLASLARLGPRDLDDESPRS